MNGRAIPVAIALGLMPGWFPAQAQVPRTPSARSGISPGRSCTAADAAFAPLAAQGLPAQRGLAIDGLNLSARRTLDRLLRDLTTLVTDRPSCRAALAYRGVVKWSVPRPGWHPKDAPGQRAGAAWEEDAVRDLAAAADGRGPVASAAATFAAQILLGTSPAAPELLPSIGPRLHAPLGTPGHAPDTLRHLVRGRLAALLGNPAAADSAFVAYGSAGGSRHVGLLELARLRLAAGEPGADTLYLEAAGSADSTVIRGLTADLALLADSAEVRAFLALAPAARPAWLLRFWEGRDFASLRPRGARLREHYRRLAHARAHFRLMDVSRHYEAFELWRNPSSELDDRGLIYVRHGEPDDTAMAASPGACPNVSWLYRRPEGNLLFHFVAREDVEDWRLIETLANATGGTGATNRLQRHFAIQGCGETLGLLESRARLDPIYGSLAVHQTRRAWERELELTTRSRRVGTTTDSHVLRFPRVMAAAAQAYALFGTTPGKGRILIVATLLAPGPGDSALAVRAVAAGPAGDVELDSVIAMPAAPARVARIVTLEVPVAPDAWTIGLALQAGDSAGEYFRFDRVTVPSETSPRLSLSDLVVASSVRGHPWQAPDGVLLLNPLGRYVRGEPIELYYETGGTAAGQELETTVSVTDERGSTQVRFAERGGPGIHRVRREIGTGHLRPGRYTLSVRISTPDGRDAERSVAVVIAEPG